MWGNCPIQWNGGFQECCYLFSYLTCLFLSGGPFYRQTQSSKKEMIRSVTQYVISKGIRMQHIIGSLKMISVSSFDRKNEKKLRWTHFNGLYAWYSYGSLYEWSLNSFGLLCLSNVVALILLSVVRIWPVSDSVACILCYKPIPLPLVYS